MTFLHRLRAWAITCWRSRRLRILVALVAFLFIQLVLWRMLFVARFVGEAPKFHSSTLFHAFVLGLRFDLRLVLVLLAPVGILFALPQRWSPLAWRAQRIAVVAYLAVLTTVLALVAVVDLGHYAYVGQRLNATAIHLLENADIALDMIWESYPIVWGLLGLIALSAGGAWIVAWWLRRVLRPPAPAEDWRRPGQVAAITVTFLLWGLGIYGRLTLYPLRWSQAFSTDNPFVVAVGLNPALYFYDTLAVRQTGYDLAVVKRAYPDMARRLGLPSDTPIGPQGPDYARYTPPAPGAGKRWNIVPVLLETQANYWMSNQGNPLDPTPHLSAILAESISCNWAYAPGYGTARSVWALFTGIPDVTQVRTSSRNPLIAHQHSLANAFADYDHFYFLGGSANWANIRGFLQYSIPDLTVIEEGNYPDDAPVDVWGVSDLAVLKRADRLLAARDGARPFFAFLQMAGNHRPYTIPRINAGFVRRDDVPPDQLLAAGFTSSDQFNAVRLIDHFIGVWADEMRSRPYFKDTIFVLFGDHGTSGPKTKSMGHDFELGLTHLRIPIIIWAPGMGLAPRRIETPVSLIDALPTVAALAGVGHLNTTLGQNLLAPDLDPDRGVFLYIDDGPRHRVGLLNRRYLLAIDGDGSRPVLNDLDAADVAADASSAHPEDFVRLREQTLGYYQTALYLLQHNQPRPHAPISAAAPPSGAAGSP